MVSGRDPKGVIHGIRAKIKKGRFEGDVGQELLAWCDRAACPTATHEELSEVARKVIAVCGKIVSSAEKQIWKKRGTLSSSRWKKAPVWRIGK